MTETVSTFETWLRDALVELRPTDGAPPALRARVAALADRQPERPLLRWLAVAAASVAAVAVVAVAAWNGSLATRPPNVGGVSPTTTWDPSIEGPGILRSVVPLLQIVPLIGAVVVLSVGLRWALRWRWHNLVIRAAPVLLAAGALASLAAVPGFDHGSAHGPMLGYDVIAQAAPGSDGPDTWYTTAEPGGSTVLMFTVRNPGPLPIRLEGLLEQGTSETPLIPRWTALWLGPPGECCATPLEELTPFQPTTVEPGEELPLYLVGRAGICAYGPGYTLDTPVSGWTSRDPVVELAYSVFGLSGQAAIELRMELAEPEQERCP